MPPSADAEANEYSRAYVAIARTPPPLAGALPILVVEIVGVVEVLLEVVVEVVLEVVVEVVLVEKVVLVGVAVVPIGGNIALPFE